MNIKYTYSWLMSGTETIIEISDRRVSKGVRSVLLIDSLPNVQLFELPDNDRLDSIISSLKGLKDGDISLLVRV